MSIMADIYTAVGPLVDDRVYPVVIPQDTLAPAIAVRRVSAPRENTLNQSSTVVNPQIEISVYAERFQEADNLRTQIRQAMKASGITSLLVDDGEDYEPNLQLYICSLTYSCYEIET